MDRRSFLKKSICGAAILASGCSKFALASEKMNKKLNFVFILIDDMGWTDLGCYGSNFHETPNIDKLASEGMKFTDAYAANPVCSPTRASIMSGKNPARLKLTQWIGGPQRETPYAEYLPLEEVTLAEAFKENGYSTGFIGKWHLSSRGTGGKHDPDKQGFDTNIAGSIYGAPNPNYFAPYKLPNMKEGPEGEYLTDRHTDDAVEFIKEHESKPFMLYLSHYAVHTPIQAHKHLIAKYEAKAEKLQKTEKVSYNIDNLWKTRVVQNDPAYAAMVESVDHSVGKVTKALKELGLDKNTAIIFMSDNGGCSTWVKGWGMPPTANTPLREGKGWLYEGGIREPMIIKWPGVTKPGSVCEFPVVSMDFYPTMLDMANLPAKPSQHVDGKNLVPLLKGKKSIKRDTLYWHYPHFHAYGNVPSGAIRHKDYKLIEYYEYGQVELYNLKNDISEELDLSIKYPEKVTELKKMLHEWLTSIDANMPTPESYDKAWEKLEKGEYWKWGKYKRKPYLGQRTN